MMNTPPDLFSQPPVRSYYVRRPQQRRRLSRPAMLLLGTLTVALLGGGAYWLGESHSENPGEIPTIAAAQPIKQKPDQPGGIDIPHQDVTVFQQLDKREEEEKQPVEHLLPQSKAPESIVTQTVSSAAPVQSSEGAAGQVSGAEGMQVPPPVKETGGVENLMPSARGPSAAAALPTNAPEAAAQQTLPVSVSAPAEPKAATPEKIEPAKPAPVEAAAPVKAVQPAPQPKEVHHAAASAPAMPKKEKQVVAAASLPEELFTGDPEKQIQKLKDTPSATPEKQAAATGRFAIQLASIPSQATASAEMQKLQSRYASLLKAHPLRLVTANLPGKGTYYRVQTQPSLSEAEAKSLCASIKGAGGSCLLAKH